MKLLQITIILFLLQAVAQAQNPQQEIRSRTKKFTKAISNEPEDTQTHEPDPDLLPLERPLINPRIVVFKSKRRLELYSNDRIVRAYRVGLGANPIDDKVREGDRCTPEGELYICIKNPKSRYYLSLGLSYPNQEDAERGLRDGLINRDEYSQIVEAIRRKRTPPQNTALGGEIFIHGHGSASDWTRGCVALNNEEMKELFEAVPVGTPVVIKP
jgi:murein L,D-transpeptidase YafK